MVGSAECTTVQRRGRVGDLLVACGRTHTLHAKTVEDCLSTGHGVLVRDTPGRQCRIWLHLAVATKIVYISTEGVATEALLVHIEQKSDLGETLGARFERCAPACAGGVVGPPVAETCACGVARASMAHINGHAIFYLPMQLSCVYS